MLFRLFGSVVVNLVVGVETFVVLAGGMIGIDTGGMGLETLKYCSIDLSWCLCFRGGKALGRFRIIRAPSGWSCSSELRTRMSK